MFSSTDQRRASLPYMQRPNAWHLWHTSRTGGFQFSQPRLCTPCRTQLPNVYQTPTPSQSPQSSTEIVLSRRKPNPSINKKPANKHKRLSFAEKRNILDALQRLTQLEAANQFSVGLRTISRIREERDAILTATSSVDSDKKSRRTKRSSVLENRILVFIRLPREKKMPVTEFVIRTTGLQERLKLLENAGSSLSASEISFLEGFKGSRNWIHRFVKYNGLKSVRLHGQGGSVDVKACKFHMEEIRPELRMYPAANIFNCDETDKYLSFFRNGLTWIQVRTQNVPEELRR